MAHGSSSEDVTSNRPAHPIPVRTLIHLGRLAVLLLVISPLHAAEITFGSGEIEIVSPRPAPHAVPERRSKESTGQNTYRNWRFDSAAAATWLGEYIRGTRFTYNLRVSTYDVDGAAGRSFRPEGHVYENNLSASNRHGFRDGRFLEWRASLRQADDPQLTTRRDVQLTGLNVGYGRTNQYEIRFGDVYSNLSRYSFSRSLEGLSAYWTTPRGRFPDWRVSLASGRVQRGIDNRQLTRYAHGFRSAWSGIVLPGKLIKPIQVGINAAGAHDDRASANVPTAAVLDGQVYSVDWMIPLELAGFLIEGELARSFVQPNTRAPESRERVGTAWRWGVRGRPMGWNLSANLERVDPDAQSPLGSIAADQFRWDMALSGRLPADLQLGLQFLRSENNVNHTLTATSVTHTFGSNLSLPVLKRFIDDRLDSTPLGLIRNAVLSAAYRISDRTTSNLSYNSTFEDQNFGFSTQWAGWRGSGNWGYQTTIDRVTRSSDRRVQNWNASLSREWAIPSVALFLTPVVTYSNSRDWGDQSHVTNRSRTATANFGWRWRDKLSGNVSYVVSNRDQQLGGNDQDQRTLSASAAWRIEAPLPSQLTLTYRRNLIDDERPGQDFEERESQFMLNTAF